MTTQEFFAIYQQANNTFDINTLATCYAETFLFGQPEGVQIVKREDFLKLLPKRKDFFKTIGQKSSEIVSVKEMELDTPYKQIQTIWKMTYEKNGKTIEDTNQATYILFKKDATLQIILQIDHQNLIKKVQALGLLS